MQFMSIDQKLMTDMFDTDAFIDLSSGLAFYKIKPFKTIYQVHELK